MQILGLIAGFFLMRWIMRVVRRRHGAAVAWGFLSVVALLFIGATMLAVVVEGPLEFSQAVMLSAFAAGCLIGAVWMAVRTAARGQLMADLYRQRAHERLIRLYSTDAAQWPDLPAGGTAGYQRDLPRSAG